MALSYSAGLAKVLGIADEQRGHQQAEIHHAPLQDATGGTVAADVLSPKSIPEYDTSAMDGYAVRSNASATASEQSPVILPVAGTIAAGDYPSEVIKDDETDANSCVEIMTGAIFPDEYDACVKVEDTMCVSGPTGKHIVVTKPVARNANRRFAGSDIQNGDVLLRRGEIVRPSHILPLASVGLDSIPLVRKPRLGIWSTGKEMINGKGATADANGPYLTAATREMGLDVDFLGVLGDDPAGLLDYLENAMGSGKYDVLVTSGAVSKGKFDFIPNVLEELGADIVFQGLAIRPGHPVLFALLPGINKRIAFFGLPGNPGAAAACFRFLAVPYLRALQNQPMEQPIPARLLRQPDTPQPKHGCHAIPNTDCFRHGVLSTSATDQLIVKPSPDQSPSKIGPFTTANCWIHLRPTHDGGRGQDTPTNLVECYPISPTGTIPLSTTLLN